MKGPKDPKGPDGGSSAREASAREASAREASAREASAEEAAVQPQRPAAERAADGLPAPAGHAGGAPAEEDSAEEDSAQEDSAREDSAERDSANEDPAKGDPAKGNSTGLDAATGDAAEEVARPRRWRRRLLQLAAAAVALRVLLGLGLEPTLRTVLAASGVQADWRLLELQLLDGRLEVQGLSVTPEAEPESGVRASAPGGEPMISVATVVLDLDTSSLLRGALRVERLVVEGAAVHLDRGAEGDWNFAAFAGDGSPAAPSEPSEAGPLLFDLPFELDQARVQDLRVRVRDLQAVPPVDLSTTTSLTLTDVGSEGELAALDLRMVSAECLDLLRLRGSGALSAEGADLSLELTLAGLRPRAALGLLAAAGIDARAERLHAEARLKLEASPLEANRDQLGARLTLDRTRIRADETEAFGLERFEVQVEALGSNVLEVGSVLVDGLVAEASLEADGSLSFAGIGPAAAKSAPPGPKSAAAGSKVATPSGTDLLAAEDSAEGTAAADDLAAGDSKAASPSAVSPSAVSLSAVSPTEAAGTEASPGAVSTAVGSTAAGSTAAVSTAAVSTAAVSSSAEPSGASSAASGPSAGAVAAADPAGAAPPAAENNEAPLRWSLGRAELKNTRLSFSDRALSEGHRITARLDSISAGPVSSDEGAPPSAVQLAATIPGVVGELTIDGTIDSFAPRFKASGGVKLVRLVPEELAPYLAMAGLEPAFESGTFEVDKIDVDGLDFAARGLRVMDQGEELAALDMVEVVVGGEDRVRASLSGARARVRRCLDDSIEAVGLRFNAGADPASAPPASAANSVGADSAGPTPAPEAAFLVPKVWLPRLDLQFERLELISDEQSEAPISIGPIAVTAGRSAGPDAGPGSFEAAASGTVRIAREFSASVRFDPQTDGGLRVRGATSARGLNLDPIKAWVELLGIEPQLQDAALDGHFEVGVRAVQGRPELALQLGPVHLEDRVGSDVTEWLDLKELRVEGLRSGGDVTAAIESLRLDEPRLRIERHEAGGWVALGMRSLPSGGDGGAAGTVRESPSAAAAPPTPSGWLELTDGRVDGASLTLVNLVEDAGPPLVLGASLSVKGLAPGAGAPPAECSAELSVGEARWTTSGKVQPDPAAPTVDLTSAMEGVNGEALERLLPEGVALDLSDGVARAQVRGSLSQPEAGGDALAIEIEDLDLRDRGADRPLLGASSLKFSAPRLDGDLGVVDVSEVSVEDLALEVVRLADGGVRVAGVDLKVASPAATAGSSAVGSTGAAGGSIDTAGAGSTDEAGAGEARPPAAPQSAAPQPAGAPPAARRRLRSVRLGALQVGLKEVRLSTEGVEADPFVVTSRVELKDAVAFDAEDFLDDAPPVEIAITGKAEPGSASLSLELAATPFDTEPELDAQIRIEGLDGEFLRSVFPERQVSSSESGFSGGSFSASVHSQFRWRRSGPLDFDLRGGFGLGLEVNDLVLRHKVEGPVMLGLDLLSLDAANISPRAGRYQFRRVEIENPQGVVRRVEEGLEVAGILVVPEAGDSTAAASTSAAGDQPDNPPGSGTPPEQAPGAVVAAAGPVAEGAGGASTGAEGEATPNEAGGDAAEASPGPDSGAALEGFAEAAPASGSGRSTANVTIEDLLLRDLDLLFEDQTVTPTLSIPLVAMDAEVRGISSKMLTQPRPLRFSLSLGGGDVSLPVRLKATSVLRGVAEGVAGAVSSREAEVVQYEDRPLFREFVTSGQLTFYPSTSGWVQGALQGFELTALRGVAIASGIDIGDGVLDVNSRTRLAGTRGGHVDSTVSLAHLSLSEPDGGPISRFLKLPAPLDTVIFVLKNEQGEIRLPLSFDFGGGSSMGVAELSAKASAAFLRLVTAALAAAPLRAVGSVTDVVGLGGLIGDRDRTPKYAGMTAELDFPVGSAHVDRQLPSPLEAIVKAMAKDPLLELEGTHHFGPADIERARELANPDSDVAVKLLEALRRERDVLARQRGELAAAARSSLTLGRDRAFDEAREALLQVSRELGEVEGRVDQVAGLLGRSSAGKAERRRRRVALDLAQSRMDALMRALLRSGVDQSRVNLKRPRYAPPDPDDDRQQSWIEVETRAGTPRQGIIGRVFSFFSF